MCINPQRPAYMVVWSRFGNVSKFKYNSDGRMDNAIKLIKQKGTTLLEALVATAIIGIGFIAIFQMVTYSVRSIDVSGERTKINYLSDMILEDLIAYKSSEKDSTKLYDIYKVDA